MEYDYFVRFNKATSIVEKIYEEGRLGFINLVSSRKPFGIETNISINKEKKDNDVYIYAYPKNGYVKQDLISSNRDWINKYKVFISYAYGERGNFPYFVLGKPFLGSKNEICSETYLVIGPFQDKQTCDNVMSYIRTKLFRFLILLRKNTQHATSKVYSFVPLQDFTKPWTDEELYKKYNLTDEEIQFIESMIKPME